MVGNITRFGSSMDSPAQASGVLRALASRLGSDLNAASAVDLVAAAIAADAWVLALDATGLGDRGVLTDGARMALTNVLLRAAGMASGEAAALGDDWPISEDARHVAAVDAYRAWAHEMLGDDASLALARAATDLAACDELRGLATLLRVIASLEG